MNISHYPIIFHICHISKSRIRFSSPINFLPRPFDNNYHHSPPNLYARLPHTPSSSFHPRLCTDSVYMPSSSSTRRPHCPGPPKLAPSCSNRPSCPSKRQRDSNSSSFRASINPRVTSPISPTSPLTLIHKRHRFAPAYQPKLTQFRVPGPPFPAAESLSSLSSSSSTPSSFSSTTTSSNHDIHLASQKRPVELPDEVLVAIFRFVDHASKLAHLRTVCKQWCNVIDHTPEVWRMVSFKNADFSQPVTRSRSALKLGSRPGERAVTTAARSGNEWARFLKKIVFDRHTLRAVTTPQPLASLLVSGERPVDARPFPPWTGDMPDNDGTWIAIHAARRGADGLRIPEQNVVNGEPVLAANEGIQASGGREGLREMDAAKLPFGAMVGIIHVRDAFQTTAADNSSSAPMWIWRIDRAVRLKKPLRCAGFLGLWSISGFLTDVLVNAMHKQ